MAQKIKRNDYFQMIRETGRTPREDEYELIPLDLSAYALNEDTRRIADANFMEETENRVGDYMLKGHWLSDLCYVFARKCNLTLHHVNAYNAFAYSDEQMCVFTYCEGDITLTPYQDREKYEREKANTIRFYKETYQC